LIITSLNDTVSSAEAICRTIRQKKPDWKIEGRGLSKHRKEIQHGWHLNTLRAQ